MMLVGNKPVNCQAGRRTGPSRLDLSLRGTGAQIPRELFSCLVNSASVLLEVIENGPTDGYFLSLPRTRICQDVLGPWLR